MKAEEQKRSEAVGNCGCKLERTEKGLKMVDCPLHKAAPDLLAALEGLFEHCSMIHKHWGEGGNQKEADATIKAGREAIEKARSKS